MKRTLFGAGTLAIAVALAPAASATAFTQANMSFVTFPDGSISAKFGNSGIKKGKFTDTFTFAVPLGSIASGSVTTSTSKFHKATDLDIYTVDLNGSFSTTNSGPGLIEFAGFSGVDIAGLVLNKITITGYSWGNGSYGANASFVPMVPEAASWAMMLVGFGFAGAAMRYQRRATQLAFS